MIAIFIIRQINVIYKVIIKKERILFCTSYFAGFEKEEDIEEEGKLLTGEQGRG
jgi:hypothetical protein